MERQMIVEHAMLQTLERLLYFDLPDSWKKLEPPADGARAAAAALIRCAEIQSLQGMASWIDHHKEQLEQRFRRRGTLKAERQDADESTPPPDTTKANPLALWKQLSNVLERLPLDPSGDPAPSFSKLAIWRDLDPDSLQDLWTTTRKAQIDHHPDDKALAAIASRLLLATARSWIREDELAKNGANQPEENT